MQSGQSMGYAISLGISLAKVSAMVAKFLMSEIKVINLIYYFFVILFYFFNLLTTKSNNT